MQQFSSDNVNYDNNSGAASAPAAAAAAGNDGEGNNRFDIMKHWIRFGLPIGSAFVTAVLLDNIIALDALLKEIVLAPSGEEEKSNVESYRYHVDQYPLLYVLIRACLSVALWGVLTKAPKTLFFIWIISAVAMDSFRHGNMKMMFDAFSSFNIYLLILMPLIRVYLFVIFIEVARIIEKQKEPRLLVGSYEGADEDLESLVPIGYDAIGVWKYYDRFHVLGSRILLTVDLVWIIVVLPAIKAALGGFGGFLLTIIGAGLAGYALVSIMQKQPSGIVIWRLAYLVYIVLVAIAFISEFNDTRKEPSDQGVISTLTLFFMFLYKIFVIWFSLGIEGSMEVVDFSGANGSRQIPQIEAAGTSTPEDGYHVNDGDWSGSAPPLTPLSGRVVITELDGRSGRGSQASRQTWGSQPLGIYHHQGLTSSREGITSSLSGWGGSQSIVSDSRIAGDITSRSGLDSQSQSQSAITSSREAFSTVSSVSGWTSTSGRDSRSDMR